MKTLYKFALLFLGMPFLAFGQVQVLPQWESYPSAPTVEEWFDDAMRAWHPQRYIQAKELRSYTDPRGWTHRRYRQHYRGIPILGAEFILHLHEGRVHRVNGYRVRNLQIDTRPTSTEEMARLAARAYYALKYRARLDASKGPAIRVSTPRLVIMQAGYPAREGRWLLAWEVKIEDALYPERNELLYIDAHTNKAIRSIPLTHSVGIPVEVSTQYHGTRTIYIDSVAPDQFRLLDSSRGTVIEVIDGFWYEVYTSTDKEDWAKYEGLSTPVDVMFGMQALHDYLLDSFGWQSYDGKGGRMTAIVHPWQYSNWVNASWSGEDRQARFGEGNCKGYGPLTSIDIVGHEFGHGFIDATSNLVYADEPGGLNESFSDILGKALEWYADREYFSWIIGEAIVEGGTAQPIRSMQNPNDYNNPKYYRGKYWQNRVHNTSGVSNYWFYLLSEGESGVNEAGVSYDVPAIGIDKAMKIVFHMHTSYLISTSTYQDAVNASIDAAKDLFGESSPEVAAVIEAWKAVGLSPTKEVDVHHDLAIKALPPEDKNEIFDFYMVCPSVVLPAQLMLYNRGLDTIAAMTALDIDIVENEDTIATETVQISKDLLPGDSVLIEIDHPYDFSEDKVFRILVYSFVLPSDDDPSNNASSLNFYIQDRGEEADLSLVSVDNIFDDLCLEKDTVISKAVTLNLVDHTCPSFDFQTRIMLYYRIDGRWDSVAIIPDLIFDFGFGIITTTYITAPLRPGENSITFVLRAEGDTDPSNDTFEYRKTIGRFVTKGYANDFTNNKDDYTVNISSESGLEYGYIPHPLRSDRQDSALAIARVSDLSDYFIEPCDALKRFYFNNPNTASANWCVVRPEESFQREDWHFRLNLVHNRAERSEYDEVEKDYQVISRIIIQDFDMSDVYTIYLDTFIYGLPNLQEVLVKLPLPEAHKFVVSTEHFTLHTAFQELELGRLKGVDAVFIDDVAIEAMSISTTEPHDERIPTLEVYPNPATDHISVRLPKLSNVPRYAAVYNSVGQRMILEAIRTHEDNLRLDVRSWSEGLYHIVIMDAAGRRMAEGSVMIVR